MDHLGISMKDEHIQQLKSLKAKFQKLKAKDRENLSVCFLKFKLGVHNTDESQTVKKFLGEFKMEINPENLDSMINYLHSQAHTLPEFIAMEDSITDIEKEITQSELPIYNPDEVDTLKEGVRPFKK